MRPKTDLQLFLPPPAPELLMPELGMCELTAYLKKAGFAVRQSDLNVLFRGSCGTENAMPLAWDPPLRRTPGLWNERAPAYRLVSLRGWPHRVRR